MTLVTASNPNRRYYDGVMLTQAFAAAIVTSALVFAHCDSLDGPVVQAARQALSAGDVNVVLAWVPPEEESTIRQAFANTQAVRKLNADAEKLADTWFFETLVRVHRAGEGEAYTGLKPAGSQVADGILAADRAISRGDVQKLEDPLINGIRATLRQRFQRVLALRRYEPGDVKAGREFVAAYVDFIHFVERLDMSAKPEPEHGNEHVH